MVMRISNARSPPTALTQLQQHEYRYTGPVFANRDGGELDAANIRREPWTTISASSRT